MHTEHTVLVSIFFFIGQWHFVGDVDSIMLTTFTSQSLFLVPNCMFVNLGTQVNF